MMFLFINIMLLISETTFHAADVQRPVGFLSAVESRRHEAIREAETRIPGGEEGIDAIQLKPFEISGVSDAFRDRLRAGILLTYRDSPYLNNALAVMDTLISLRPDRPEGYFLKAALYLSIYQVHENKAVFDSVRVFADKAIKLCNVLIKENPDDPYVNFYLGALYGNMGLQYLRQKSYWKAYKNGKKGKNYLEKALELNPALADAYLGLGIYNYYAAVLPKYIKPLLFILRLKGDRTKGLSYIRYAAEKSALSQVEAAYFLAKILNEYEGNGEEAEKIIRLLHATFPKNLFYHNALAVFHYENGDFTQSLDTFRELRTRPHKYYNRTVGYFMGLLLHEMGEYSHSTEILEPLIKTFPETQTERVSRVFYLIGLNYEYLNDRERALPYYRDAQKKGSKKLKKLAAIRLKQPLSAEDVRVRQVDALVKQKRYREATARIVRYMNAVDEKLTKKTFYESAYSIHLAEAYEGLGRYREAYDILSGISEQTLADDEELKAEYHLAGASATLNVSDFVSLENHFKRLQNIELKNLPVYHRRKFNSLQFRYYGEVKFK